MLQNSLILQTIISIAILAIFYFGFLFYEKSKIVMVQKRKKYELFSVISIITAAIGFGYFFISLFPTMENKSDFWIVLLKMIIVEISAIEIILYKKDKLMNVAMQLTTISCSVLTTAFILFCYWLVKFV